MCNAQCNVGKIVMVQSGEPNPGCFGICPWVSFSYNFLYYQHHNSCHILECLVLCSQYVIWEGRCISHLAHWMFNSGNLLRVNVIEFKK